DLILFNCVSCVSSESTKLGKSVSTFDRGLCDFGLPSQPSNFLETCWVLSLLGYGSSVGGIKSLPSGLKGWGRHVMGLEALARKRVDFDYHGVDFDFSELTFVDHGL
nr:hypothetical protein [Tanacetum cinerariifolium]